MRSVPKVALAALVTAAFAACGSAREVEGANLATCARCHGFPPSQATTGRAHPSDVNCVGCHATTVDAQNELIEGGAHLNGDVDTTGHPLPYLAQHDDDATAVIASCTVCHGQEYGGGIAQSCNACHQTTLGFADWRTNCTFCHGDRTPGWDGTPAAAAAPPAPVAPGAGETNANPAVGAHQAHLVGGTYSGAIACEVCHDVPAATFPASLDHLDGRAAVRFGGVAAQGAASARYANGSCTVYCHGSTSQLGGGANRTPAWTSTGLACDACHTLQPTSGFHTLHLERTVACEQCHPGFAVGVSPTVDLAVHVNGAFEASVATTTTVFSAWPTGCAACHPDGIPAP